MEAQPKEIRRYITPDGRIPFLEWYYSLRDSKAKFKIDARLERVELGNLGDYAGVGEGVFEFRINYGPGYRIYFGQIGSTIVLLCAVEIKAPKNKIFVAALRVLGRL